MIYLFATLAVGLLVAAALRWSDDRWAAYFFIACALLNIGAGAHMLVKNDDHAYRLHSQDEAPPSEPDPGMPDRR
jgi:hypothetical protein